MMGAMNRPSDCRIPMVIMRMAAATTMSSSARRSSPVAVGLAVVSFIGVPANHRRRVELTPVQLVRSLRDTGRMFLQQRARRHFHLRGFGERGGAGGIECELRAAAYEQ